MYSLRRAAYPTGIVYAGFGIGLLLQWYVLDVMILDEAGFQFAESDADFGTALRRLAEQPDDEGVVIIRPEAEGARVERLGDHEFRLIGRQVERIVALNDVTTPEAMSYIDFQMKRLGVQRLLARAGVGDGDIVWISAFSFEYQREA